MSIDEKPLTNAELQEVRDFPALLERLMEEREGYIAANLDLSGRLARLASRNAVLEAAYLTWTRAPAAEAPPTGSEG